MGTGCPGCPRVEIAVCSLVPSVSVCTFASSYITSPPCTFTLLIVSSPCTFNVCSSCVLDVISYVGIWYDGTTRFDILYEQNTVYDMVYLVCWWYGIWEKRRIWSSMLTVWYRRNTVYGMVYVGGMVRWYGVVDVVYS